MIDHPFDRTLQRMAEELAGTLDERDRADDHHHTGYAALWSHRGPKAESRRPTPPSLRAILDGVSRSGGPGAQRFAAEARRIELREPNGGRIVTSSASPDTRTSTPAETTAQEAGEMLEQAFVLWLGSESAAKIAAAGRE
jgi:hypothetical protein